MTSTSELLFSKDGVFIHVTTPQADEEVLLAGTVYLWQRQHGVFLEWLPVNESAKVDRVDTKADTDWMMVNAETGSVSYKTERQSATDAPARSGMTSHSPKYVVNFDIKDLKTFRRSKPSLGWSYLIFILKCGTTYPALHFHFGGTKNIIQELRKHLHIKTSSQDSCLYLVHDFDSQALFKSYDELQLFDKTDGSEDILSKFIQDPYSATLGGFSKVTHFLRDTLLTPDRQDLTTSFENNVANVQGDVIAELAVNTSTEAGFEIVTTRELPELIEVKRSQPVTSEQWSSYMDADGRVTDVDAVKEAVFRGGVDGHIRTEVWKFLLGYYEWKSTYKMRMELRKDKVDAYFRMKLQWKSMSQDQESRFSDLRDRKSLIEKDVSRTDRVHKFFQGENNPNIGVLYDILMTHCMYNFDHGYVQGMSDLLAPILVVMENEVDAFWCFAGFIEMMGSNFDKDQQSMKNQLFQLKTIMEFYDPEFANYLESQESNNMYFCFRWLLILFKREFSFPDIMRLWEVLWTGKPCQNFHLLICLSILVTERATFIENGFGFTEILKHVNDMSGTMDVDSILKHSEAIFFQLRDCRDLPRDIHHILSLSSSSVNNPFSSQLPCDSPLSSPSVSRQRSPVRSTPSQSQLPGGEPHASQTLHGSTGQYCREQVDVDNKFSPVTTSSNTGDLTPADDSSIEILSEAI